jgi:hypothetical protein
MHVASSSFDMHVSSSSYGMHVSSSSHGMHVPLLVVLSNINEELILVSNLANRVLRSSIS